MDFLSYVVAGVVVGLAIGATGVGGGSLMTPLLLALGFPLHIAVGTDLLFAALTKSSGVVIHSLQKSVRWPLVIGMASGSLPAAALTILVLRFVFHGPNEYSGIITMTLGLTLILTSIAVLFKSRLSEFASHSSLFTEARYGTWAPLTGAVLGVLVTLSSVGAGALGTALLLIFCPRLTTAEVVGTGIAWAVPLTLSAGIGHMYLGNVDFLLLLALLAGSVPAISVGARLTRYAPEKFMRPLLATTLCGVGIKFAFF